jgi:thiamine transport system ATP-binding protein
MLRLEGLGVRVGDFALELSLDLPETARLGLLGPSGSGKSTLLNTLAGFLQADKGRIFLGPEEISELPVAARPLSILFQDSNLFPHLTVFDNVALGLRPDLKLSEAECGRITEILVQVGLAEMSDRRPADLSGGQQSRVGLARMLIRDKPLALLDEPFAALDPGLRTEMLTLVRELCITRQMTLVTVSHDLRDVERLCTHLCLLDEGQVQIFGALDEILSDAPAALRPWQ